MAESTAIEWTDAKRFWAKVDFHSVEGCWTWVGAVGSHGYGNFYAGGKYVLAHRWVYEQTVGAPIPEGQTIDHLCCNTLCVRPEHMEVVSYAENNRRSNGPSGINARKTHCDKGHPFDIINTVYRNRGRECRECRRERDRGRRDAAFWREYRAKRKAVSNG